MRELYLCGTSHLDLAGAERLRKFLRVLHPDTIAIESYEALSSEVLAKRKEWAKMDEQILAKKLRNEGKSLHDGVRLDTMASVVRSIGYEIWVPFEYKRKYGTRIAHMEDEGLVEIIEGMLSKNRIPLSLDGPQLDLFKLTTIELKKYVDMVYLACEFNNNGLKNNSKDDMAKRNKIFADKIRHLEGKVLVVTGADHIYGDEPSLQILLKEHNPLSFSLIYADYLRTKNGKPIS